MNLYLPCPKCGIEDNNDTRGFDDRTLSFNGEGGIWCLNCDFEGPDGGGSKYEAERLWNELPRLKTK